MRKFTLLLLLLPLLTKGQIQGNTIITSANINIESKNQLDEKNTQFQISLGSRTGRFNRDTSWAFGINWSLIYRHTKVFKISSIQTSGNTYEKGGGDGVYGSVGFFADKYFKIRPNLYLSLNNDLSYFIGQFIENTTVVDASGNDVGILVQTYQYNPARIQYNFWPNLTYFFTRRHALTASIGNFNIGLLGKDPTSGRFLGSIRNLNINLNFPSVALGYSMIF